MNNIKHNLWKKILSYELDEKDSHFTFSDRLKRENGWTANYTERVIQEYKKFIYLICLGFELTPSDAVDQVWHLHLTYTKDYWINFCKNTLEKDIHHNPTKGGKMEREKFTHLYYKFFSLYYSTFGERPPTNIWPSPDERFAEVDFRRVNMNRNWVIPKPKWFWKKIKEESTLTFPPPPARVTSTTKYPASKTSPPTQNLKKEDKTSDAGDGGGFWGNFFDWGGSDSSSDSGGDSGCSSSGCSGCSGCGGCS